MILRFVVSFLSPLWPWDRGVSACRRETARIRRGGGWGLLLVSFLLAQGPARAVTLVRDAEIEDLITQIAAPLLTARGVSQDHLEIHLVWDARLNAYLTGGRYLVLNTGLLSWAARQPFPESQDALAAVIAHELGHYVGGHLIARRQEKEQAIQRSIATALLGFGVAVLSASPELAVAGVHIGRETTQRQYLSFSRGQEEQADVFAVNLLKRQGIPLCGLQRILEQMITRSENFFAVRDPYVLTHPRPRARYRSLGAPLESCQRRASLPTVPTQPARAFRRALAKMQGFILPIEQVFRLYPADDLSPSAGVARAVAYHRMGDLTQALAQLALVQAQSPQDPYLHELMGQILFEQGRNAVIPYQKALALLPHQPLLRLGLARALLAQDAPTKARLHLEVARDLERDNAQVWHFLGVTYGRLGERGKAALALAEEAWLSRDLKRARLQVRRALALLPKQAEAHRQAQSLLAAMQRQ